LIPRPTSLFRGSELPRLLFLLAIVIAGWSSFIVYSRSEERPQPKPTIIPAAKITPVVPDNGVEFQAIRDKAPILPRETAAYAKLLERARETSADALAKQARRDIFFTHVWERPEKYRGVPVHLQGIAKKILTFEVAPTLSPTERLYEVWFYTDENGSFPNLVILQDPPAGLAVGDELNLRVTVDGYFMKLMGYRAGDTFRAAPLFVGRMHWTPAPVAAPSTMSEFSRFSRRDLGIGIFLLILAYITIRVILQVRKARALGRPQSNLTSSSAEGLAPEELAEWLQNLPDDTEEEHTEHSTR
jgi:hypothetical protein